MFCDPFITVIYFMARMAVYILMLSYFKLTINAIKLAFINYIKINHGFKDSDRKLKLYTLVITFFVSLLTK